MSNSKAGFIAKGNLSSMVTSTGFTAQIMQNGHFRVQRTDSLQAYDPCITVLLQADLIFPCKPSECQKDHL